MLRELHIQNLAVIVDAKIDLADGLNCFTGATGAGKSLVIGAIELLLGLRTPTDMLRRGEDEARVTGLFHISDPQTAAQLAKAGDIGTQETADSSGQKYPGIELLLTRRIFSSGRSSVSINGQPITLAMLRNVAELLVDVHGQHDQQYLLRPANQLQVLDDFADTLSLREQYAEVYQQLSTAVAQIAAFETGKRLREQQIDLGRFQLAEIDAAELRPGEFEELSARATVLGNVEKLRKEAGAVHVALQDSDGAISDRLAAMTGILAELADVDRTLSGVATAVREATVQLSEAAFDLGRYLDKLDFDPEELAEVSDRLNVVNRVLKKYGPTVENALAEREQLFTTVLNLERAEDNLAAMRAAVEPLKTNLKQLAGELTTRRTAAAKKLSPLIEQQLAELGMEKARFRVDIKPTEPSPGGSDEVEFIVQTNAGLSAAPLRKIASGGEIGRVMLALKSVLAIGGQVSVLVFDEIDANIGGRLGSVIGQKLRTLSAGHQVLCITHLPQIACFADRHFTVEKTSATDSTNTRIRSVTGRDRIAELAEMIGGQHVTPTTLAQAEELLTSATSAPVGGSTAPGAAGGSTTSPAEPSAGSEDIGNRPSDKTASRAPTPPGRPGRPSSPAPAKSATPAPAKRSSARRRKPAV